MGTSDDVACVFCSGFARRGDLLHKLVLEFGIEAGPVKHVLFVCSQNRLRSSTAEQVFSQRSDIAVQSAGTNNDADNPLTRELVEWADIIFVMEEGHRRKLQQRFRPALRTARVVCLGIPDDYAFMDPVLVRMLEAKVSRYLPLPRSPQE